MDPMLLTTIDWSLPFHYQKSSVGPFPKNKKRPCIEKPSKKKREKLADTLDEDLREEKKKAKNRDASRSLRDRTAKYAEDIETYAEDLERNRSLLERDASALEKNNDMLKRLVGMYQAVLSTSERDARQTFGDLQRLASEQQQQQQPSFTSQVLQHNNNLDIMFPTQDEAFESLSSEPLETHYPALGSFLKKIGCEDVGVEEVASLAETITRSDETEIREGSSLLHLRPARSEQPNKTPQCEDGILLPNTNTHPAAHSERVDEEDNCVPQGQFEETRGLLPGEQCTENFFSSETSEPAVFVRPLLSALFQRVIFFAFLISACAQTFLTFPSFIMKKELAIHILSYLFQVRQMAPYLALTLASSHHLLTPVFPSLATTLTSSSHSPVPPRPQFPSTTMSSSTSMPPSTLMSFSPLAPPPLMSMTALDENSFSQFFHPPIAFDLCNG